MAPLFFVKILASSTNALHHSNMSQSFAGGFQRDEDSMSIRKVPDVIAINPKILCVVFHPFQHMFFFVDCYRRFVISVYSTTAKFAKVSFN
jgi:hypothetical protein